MYRFFDEVTVSGASKSTVINKLLQKNVRIFRAECLENGIKFRIKPNDRQKVIEIFDAICYNYKIVKGIDKNFVFGFLKRRWAIAVFFALVTVMFALIPRYVYTVSVDAPSYLYDEVKGVLMESGVKRWKKTSDVDAKNVERRISEIDGVSFADVKVSGSTVYVSVRPSLKKAEIVDVQKDLPLYSAVDAVITRQIVFSGTPAFKAGDSVKAGDALIFPYVTSGEDNLPTGANGEVFGIIGYSATVSYGGSMTTYEKNGNSKTYRVVDFMGLTGKMPKSPYKLYETRTRKVECGFLIPLGFLEITFDEIVGTTISLPYEQAKDAVIKRASEQAEKVVPEDARVIRREINEVEAGGVYYVTATVYAEGRIDASR